MFVPKVLRNDQNLEDPGRALRAHCRVWGLLLGKLLGWSDTVGGAEGLRTPTGGKDLQGGSAKFTIHRPLGSLDLLLALKPEWDRQEVQMVNSGSAMDWLGDCRQINYLLWISLS